MMFFYYNKFKLKKYFIKVLTFGRFNISLNFRVCIIELYEKIEFYFEFKII